jgi:hypothetical protein
MLTLLFFVCILIGCAHPTDSGSATPPCGPVAVEADPPAAMFRRVPHPTGAAWRWPDEVPVEVVLVEPATPDLTGGLYIRRGDLDLAAWTTRSWLGDEGWVPVVLAGRRPGLRPQTSAGSTLHLNLAGSTEHGCPDVGVAVSVRAVGETAVEVSLVGVPYLSLPPDAVISAWSEEGLQRWRPGDLAPDDQVWLTAPRRLVAVSPDMGVVELEFPVPPPVLQLQGWDGFVEVDFDHGCESGEWAGGPVVLRAHPGIDGGGG